MNGSNPKNKPMYARYRFVLGKSLALGAFLFAFAPSSASGQAGSEDQELNSAFRFSPLRMATGTFQLEYERQVADRFTLSFMGMGTYLSRNGLGGWYLNSLGRSNFDQTIKSNGQKTTIPYKAEVMAGAGLIVQGRQYFYAHDDEPKGLYFGPTVMYRRLSLTTKTQNSVQNIEIKEKQQRSLGIFKGGIIAGAQLPIISKKLVFDAYGGAVFRMSSYGDETGPSDYNAWTALDHSGVTFTIGLSVGAVFGKGDDSDSSEGESGEGGEGTSAPGEL